MVHQSNQLHLMNQPNNNSIKEYIFPYIVGRFNALITTMDVEYLTDELILEK